MKSPPSLTLAFAVLVALAAGASAQQPKPDARSKQDELQAAFDKKYGPQLKPNLWFPVADMDLGVHQGPTTAIGKFPFINPRDETIVWSNLKGSCTCGMAYVRVGGETYELTPGKGADKGRPSLVRLAEVDGRESREPVTQIEIPAGQQGEVEVRLELGEQGPKQAVLDIHTTDEELPQLKLRWRGRSAAAFIVTPKQVNLGAVSWDEVREFEVTVTSPIHGDFAIEGVRAIKGVGGDVGELEFEWVKKMHGKRALWTIRGKFGPARREFLGGHNVEFETSVRQPIPLRITAKVESPTSVDPGRFLALGMVRRGEGLDREVRITARDGSKLVAKHVALEDCTFDREFVEIAARQDGDAVVIGLSVGANAPRGLLKGAIVVDLDHPLVDRERIQFNGFVR